MPLPTIIFSFLAYFIPRFAIIIMFSELLPKNLNPNSSKFLQLRGYSNFWRTYKIGRFAKIVKRRYTFLSVPWVIKLNQHFKKIYGVRPILYEDHMDYH